MTQARRRRRVSQEQIAGTLRRDKAAVVRASDLTVDVTDLLSVDFDVAKMLAGVTIALQGSARLNRKELRHITDIIITIQDALAFRTIALLGRLVDASHRPASISRCDTTGQGICAECARINRLGKFATEADYASLGARRRDRIETMQMPELKSRLAPEQWVELRLRLRAAGGHRVANLRRAAKWLLRGLEVEHAVTLAMMSRD